MAGADAPGALTVGLFILCIRRDHCAATRLISLWIFLCRQHGDSDRRTQAFDGTRVSAAGPSPTATGRMHRVRYPSSGSLYANPSKISRYRRHRSRSAYRKSSSGSGCRRFATQADGQEGLRVDQARGDAEPVQASIHNMGMPGPGLPRRDAEGLSERTGGRPCARPCRCRFARACRGREVSRRPRQPNYVASLAEPQTVTSAPVSPVTRHAGSACALRRAENGQGTGSRRKAAGGIVLNVHTGEIVAMASLPDYNPNDPKTSLDKTRINRMTCGRLRARLDLQGDHLRHGARRRCDNPQ